MATPTTNPGGVLVLTTPHNGVTVIPSGTPLARLNYFDGKFLRADDLRAEQLYLRNLVRLSNKSGGHGVAHGFSVTQGAGDQLKVSPGLAVNADGQVILLTGAVAVSLVELINQTRQVLAVQRATTADARFGDCVEAIAPPPSQVLEVNDLFVITVAPAEALCGQEDVYGKLCEDACVTSTDRPFVVEGIVLRARPLVLSKPLPVSSAFPFDQSHLRSRVASAVFAAEPTLVGSLISSAGLESHVWCLGARDDGGTEVPLAVVDRSGVAVGFLDAWTVRREKIDTVAKRYWQWRMAMRPWDVYLAQILQFQCQLAELLHHGPQGPTDDPCSSAKDLVKQASVRFEEVTQFYSKVAAKLATLDVEGLPGGLGLLSSFQTKLADFTKLIQLPPQDRRLLRGGIVETPSAGYLPVVPGESATVNAQVRQWMGEGVDLRFCVVRPDFVPHALEEAQHMERISLTQGLDNPQAKPQVDVLVPNGVILKQPTASPGQGYEAVVQLFPKHNDDQPQLMAMRIAPAASINLQGAATTHSLPAGGAAFYLAGASVAPKTSVIKGLMETLTEVGSSHLSNLSDLRNAANIQPAPTGNIGSNAALFSRLNLNAATAARIAAALRAGETTVAPPPVAQQVAAIWIQLSCSHNPFMLSLGATAAASLRVTTVLPGNTGNPTPGTTDYRLFGDLVITQAASGGGTKTVRGAFSGTYVIDNQTAPVGGPLRFEIEATYDVNADTVHVKLTGLNSSKLTIQFEVKTAWQGDPQKVLSHVVYRVLRGDTMSQEVSLLGSSLTRNDEVLQAGQASHTAALSALDVIAAALKDSAFADMAAGLLFPPPPPPSSDLVVRATLDWVLFHRRRTKTCATETVNVVASARRYQVFHLRAPNADEAAEVIKALLNNDSAALQRFGFKPVDVVEFAAGGPALNTPASAIQADWSVASPPPSQVHYAAIASQGAATADGNSLALQRLGRFQDAILPLSPPEPQARYETLPLFPTALPAPGLDGDIVVITIAAPIFTTHRVLRTFLALTDLLKIIQKNGISKTVADQHAQDLGLVQFREHTSDPKTDDLDGIKSKWISSGPGTVIDVGVVFDPADTSDTSATRVGQSKAICKEIGVTLTPHTFPITVTVEPVVNSVTILQVQPVVIEVIANRRARLLIWRPDVTGAGRILLPLPGPITLEFKPDGALVKRLTAAEVKALKTFGSTVRLTEFFTREAIPDAQVEDRAKALAKELDSQGFKPTITPKIAPLPPAISGLVPADAASSQDIVFLEVLG